MKKSWKTTLFGAGGLVAVLSGAVIAIFDDNPATIPDWAAVVGAVSIAFGLLNARDKYVTSKEQGAE